MELSRVGPFSASVVEETKDQIFDETQLDERISRLSLDRLSSSSSVCIASPGAASSVGSVSSPLDSPSVTRKIEKAIETELQRFPGPLSWVQSLIRSGEFPQREIEYIMLYNEQSQKCPPNLRAALLLVKAIQALAAKTIAGHETELYSYVVQFMVSFLPNDIPEVLLHDNAISDENFSTYMQLFQQFGIASHDREKKTISIDPEFQALLWTCYYPEASNDHYIAFDEFFAGRITSANENDYPLVKTHLRAYLACPGHDTSSIYYQFLKQFVEGPMRLVRLWQERAEHILSGKYLDAAKISMQLGQYARAKRELVRAAKHCDKKIQSDFLISLKQHVFLHYAKVCCEMNEFQEVLQRVESLQHHFPVACMLLKTESYLGLQRMEDAEKELNELLRAKKTPEETVEFFILRAKVEIHFKNIDVALGYLLAAKEMYKQCDQSFEKERELELLQLSCQLSSQSYIACVALVMEIQQQLGCAHPLYAYALFTQSRIMTHLNIPGAHIPYNAALFLMKKLFDEV